MDRDIQLDDARFRQAMGHFASGVTVVTTRHAGVLYGLTVSSFTSLSLKPPLILICIDKGVPSHTAILEAGCFVVNILEAQQEHLSRRFAMSRDDKFNGVAWHTGQLEIPILDHSLTAVECRIHGSFEGGDHSIFVGAVVNTEIREGSPLLYYRRGYHEIK